MSIASWNLTGPLAKHSPSRTDATDTRPARGRTTRALVALAIAFAMATTAASAESGKDRPFGATVHGHSTVAPTSDPCVLGIAEAGTGTAVHMGKVAWAASETLNLCTNPEGADARANFVMTAADGDQVFGQYVSVVRLDPQTGVFTFAGRWQIAGGSGRFQNAVGEERSSARDA
jgi:hypothetical protein